MKVIIEDSEIAELTIEESIQSSDNGLVVVPKTRGPESLTTEQKEIIANTAIELGATRAAEIHGVSQQSASRYANGQAIKDPETVARILDTKHEIKDLATTKLLATLNLIDPTDYEPKDLPRVAGQLSQIVDRIESGSKNDKGQSVHLHMYAPTQKKVGNYEIIDV